MIPFRFDLDSISQHVIKYGVEVRPGINLELERTKLQDFANCLIDQFRSVFETLLSGPRQFNINKAFKLDGGKQAQLSTFMLTARGLVFTFPKRLFLGMPQDLDLGDVHSMFLEAMGQLKRRFSDKVIARINLTHELILNTDQESSLDIAASYLAQGRWKEGLKNMRIVLESTHDGKNVAIEIKPTFQSPAGKPPAGPVENAKYGMIVVANLSAVCAEKSVGRAEIEGLQAFSEYFIPQELLNYLNGD
jgi:hypothetical protein